MKPQGQTCDDLLPGGRTAPPAAHSLAAPDNDEIDALSERLTTLAARITATNAGTRGINLPSWPLAEYLPSLSHAPPGPAAPGRQNPPPLNSDADGRLWPQLPVPPQPPANVPEYKLLKAKLAEQTEELAQRHAQIADLSDIQQAQAGDLQLTRDHIIRLNNTIAELQRQNSERDIEIAGHAQKRIQAENENVELRALLDAALKSSAQLSQRLLDTEIVLNDRIVDVTAGQETIERLSAELAATQLQAQQMVAAARTESREAIAAAQAKTDSAIAAARSEIGIKVAAAEEKTTRIFSEDRQLQSQRHDQRVNALQNRIAECDRQAKLFERAYAELAGCCDGLSNKVDVLQGLREQAGKTIQAQREQIEFLETMMKVERQNAEATIQEMIAEFQREQKRIQAREQASAEIRKNIVQLLPKLLEQRRTNAATMAAAEGEPETAEPCAQQVA